MKHDPLFRQMTEKTGYLKPPRASAAQEADEDPDVDVDGGDQKVAVESNRVTRRVLEGVRAQQLEIAREEGQAAASSRAQQLGGLLSGSGSGAAADAEADDADEAEEYGLKAGEEDDENQNEDFEVLGVSAEDERLLRLFMNPSRAKRRTLADIIQDAIEKKELEQVAGAAREEKAKLHPKVVDVYKEVGNFLSHYTSGRVPKPFKLIPRLKNWEEILHLTNPERWTAQSMFVATRMFASAAGSRIAQRFYALVLLPRVRRDIETHRRLNYHLYRSVQKAIFKPAAFFRGLMLPLATEGCTLRESIVMCSVLAKSSIPAMHASVAILKLASMAYTGTETIFLRTLLNKKYALPFRVIDSVVTHFSRFTVETRRLPVVWHQTLLVFVQRYKNSLKPKQIATLKALTRKQAHRLISPEIRRELTAAGGLLSTAAKMDTV